MLRTIGHWLIGLISGQWLFDLNMSREFNRKLRVWGFLVVFSAYLLCIAYARDSVYSWVGPPMILSWIGGVALYDEQERKATQRRRQMGRVSNFGTPAGMPLGRLTSLSGGGDLRADPHPAGAIWDGGDRIYVANTQSNTVTRIEVPKPIRVSRYERVSDPARWVI